MEKKKEKAFLYSLHCYSAQLHLWDWSPKDKGKKKKTVKLYISRQIKHIYSFNAFTVFGLSFLRLFYFFSLLFSVA